MTEPFKYLHKGLSKKHCNMEKDLRGPRFHFLDGDLPNDISSVSPSMLSKGTTVEPNP